jgi:hypothetical protein
VEMLVVSAGLLVFPDLHANKKKHKDRNGMNIFFIR